MGVDPAQRPPGVRPPGCPQPRQDKAPLGLHQCLARASPQGWGSAGSLGRRNWGRMGWIALNLGCTHTGVCVSSPGPGRQAEKEHQPGSKRSLTPAQAAKP